MCASNEGAVSFGVLTMNAEPAEWTAPREARILPGAADAQCVDGRLLVSEIHADGFAARPLGRGNYHIYDYALFAMNLRKNAEARVAAYLAAHPAALSVSSGTGAPGPA